MKYIKQLALRMIPRRYVPPVLYFYVTIRYLGLRFKCPCCGGHFQKFLPFGVIPRPNAACPRCFSLERHRLLWMYLKDKTNFFKEKLRVLDIAPSPFFRQKCKAMSNLEYISGDLYSPLAMVRLDITNISFPDNQFDSIICYHVLEHIIDDRKAIKDLFRILKPGGWAILQTPIDPNLDKTFEDPNIISPEEREKFFGLSDHVRIYGKDYKYRLEEAGFEVTVDDYVRHLGDSAIRKYGLMENEDIYLCSKPK